MKTITSVMAHEGSARKRDPSSLLRVEQKHPLGQVMAKGTIEMLVVSTAILIGTGDATKIEAQDTTNTPQFNLRWNASLTPTAAGYDVYYGTNSGAYNSKVNVGNNTHWVMEGLIPNTKYYFAVDTYDAFGNTSVLSEEISFMTPGPLQISQDSSGNPILSYTIANPGQFIEIHAKQSLSDTNAWQTIYTSPIATGLIQYQDQAASTNQTMFYRVEVYYP